MIAYMYVGKSEVIINCEHNLLSDNDNNIGDSVRLMLFWFSMEFASLKICALICIISQF